MSLNDKLKTARSHLGKSQKEMAEMVGAGCRSWQGYEQGTNTPGGKVFEALLKLGFNISWFYSDDVQMLLVDREAHNKPELSSSLDEELLTAAIEAIEEALAKANRTMKPAKKAELIAAVYDLYSDTGLDVAKKGVLKFLKAAV